MSILPLLIFLTCIMISWWSRHLLGQLEWNRVKRPRSTCKAELILMNLICLLFHLESEVVFLKGDLDHQTLKNNALKLLEFLLFNQNLTQPEINILIYFKYKNTIVYINITSLELYCFICTKQPISKYYFLPLFLMNPTNSSNFTPNMIGSGSKIYCVINILLFIFAATIVVKTIIVPYLER